MSIILGIDPGSRITGYGLIKEEQQMVLFKELLGGPAVLKPLTGSGSELVFLCEDAKTCGKAFLTIKENLNAHLNKRMYSARYMPKEHDPHSVIVMEQYVGGDEYSCDFVLDSNKATLIRFSKKMFCADADFGTVSAYVVPARIPDGWNRKRLEDRLLAASACLGLNRMIAMADFKFDNDEFYLLELTPRPGGDCLVPLIKASSGFDMLAAALDFAEGKNFLIPDIEQWKQMVGMQIIARSPGILKEIDITLLEKDSRVLSVQLKRKPGDIILLPPQDYDSMKLGYVIFKPDEETDLDIQCRQILEKCVIHLKERNAIGQISS